MQRWPPLPRVLVAGPSRSALRFARCEQWNAQVCEVAGSEPAPTYLWRLPAVLRPVNEPAENTRPTIREIALLRTSLDNVPCGRTF